MSNDKKILLGKIREGGAYPDCWHIPGGGVDAGETKEQALIRETHEEIGIDITSYPHVLISDTGTGSAQKTDKLTGELMLVTMHFTVYQVNLDKDATDIRVELHDDLKEYVWVPLSDLKNYTHTPPSHELFTKLGWLS